jgi:hypothetical protein
MASARLMVSSYSYQLRSSQGCLSSEPNRCVSRVSRDAVIRSLWVRHYGNTWSQRQTVTSEMRGGPPAMGTPPVNR